WTTGSDGNSIVVPQCSRPVDCDELIERLYHFNFPISGTIKSVPGGALMRVVIILISVLMLIVPSFQAADTLPRTIPDDAFWRMISDYSESGGSFRFEYMSNELQFQYVVPRLKADRKPGNVYLGVGPEQNFTYIAAIQPKMAFIFDIRRQN